FIRIHEDARLLQKDRRPQPRGEDEVAVQESSALAEDIEDFFGVHAGSFRLAFHSILVSTPASAAVARRTSDSPGVSRRVAMTSVSCARSRTSISMTKLWKSGEPTCIERLWMLASPAAMADETWASVPGLLRASMAITHL